MPTFSTTTDQDKMVCGLLLMGTMKSYFEYVVMECGIPEVTLMGTLEDWQQLRELADHLLDFDDVKAMRKWHKLLVPVLDKFVESYERATNDEKPDRKFWISHQRFLRFQSRLSVVAKHKNASFTQGR